jgi:GR25 family glycosyltransferase involved in LPS biosynthesis
VNPAVLCIHVPASTARRERMERRFRHHGLDRAQFVPAHEVTIPRDDSEEWKAMAGRHTTASHVECMRLLLSEVPESEGGAIICEDDVLIRDDFSVRLPEAIANLPEDAEVLLLGFMILGWPSDLQWSGRNPDRHNLVPVLPGVSWGAHGYWVTHRYAREVVDRLGSIEIEDLSNVVEDQITFPANAHAAYPPLMLQETIDSVVRPPHELPTHVQMQSAWPYSDYAAAEPEPPLSPLADLPAPMIEGGPLLGDLVEALFAATHGGSLELEGTELGEVDLGRGLLLALESVGPGWHRLETRDASGAVQGASPSFRFSNRPVEAPTGIGVADDMLVLGFVVDGRDGALAACKLEAALGLITPIA